MRTLVLALAVFATTPALARPGFYMGLMGGGTSVSGEEGITDSRLGKDAGSDASIYLNGNTISTHVAGGLTGGLRLGFNILGYGAIEAVTTYQGSNFLDSDLREQAVHIHGGVRAYPLWHWQTQLPKYLQPLEPSLYFGYGYGFSTYTPEWNVDPVGFRGTSWRMGVGAEYFFAWFLLGGAKVTLDYNYVQATSSTFIFNFDESINFPMEPPSKSGNHQFMIGIAFQFGPPVEGLLYGTGEAERRDERRSRDDDEPLLAPKPLEPAPAPITPVPSPEAASEPEPTPAPAPAGPAVIDG